MRINLNTIYKSKRDEYSPLLDNYKKLISKYATLNENDIFNKTIEKSQKQGREEARKSYSESLVPHLGSFNIVLDERGEHLASEEFSKLFENLPQGELNLFIGGSYGLEDEFIEKCHKRVSLGKMTLPHRMAKLVLLEQIYRGFTIINNHPYHK